MDYRRLGRSGLLVSELAFGNWLTHGGQVEEDAATACVRAALDVGITFFDTADVYTLGKAESVLGRALKGERRSSYVLATKVFWPTGDKPTDRGLSRKHVIESCHASLERLQTDYVDLYQAHRYDAETPLEETLRAFDDLVRQGKVLYVGVSEWTAQQQADALRIAADMGFDRIVSSQPQYSMLWRVIEAEVLPLGLQEGIGQIVWSPLRYGVLSGKYLPGQPPPEGSRATDESGSRFMQPALTDEVLTAVQQLKPIAEGAGLTMPQLALAWILNQPGITAAIIGASRPEQVHDNAGASGVRLDDDTLAAIDAALDPYVERDPAKTG